MAEVRPASLNNDVEFGGIFAEDVNTYRLSRSFCIRYAACPSSVPPRTILIPAPLTTRVSRLCLPMYP